MLTENEARDLLARAAATIEVPPAAPIPADTGRQRRWLVPAVAAASAVVLIVTGGALLRYQLASDRSPTTSPTITDRVIPAEPRVPSVFAYSATAAERLLAEDRLVVVRKPSYTCLTPGRAVRTDPAAGAPIKPGDEVTLFVTEPPTNARCVAPAKDALAWRLLDFANGRGPAPTYASKVTVYVDGHRTTLTRAEASDPDSWGPGSALGRLATATRQEQPSQDTTTTPRLTVHTDDGTRFVCGGQDLPTEFAGRGSTWLNVAIPSPGFITGICTFANVYQTNGQIDAIVVRTSHTGGPGTTNPGPEPGPDPDGIAATFLAYARGASDELPMAAHVRLYLGFQYRKSITAVDIGDRSAWDVCANYAERICPMSAVATLRNLSGQPAVADSLLTPDLCLNPFAEEPERTGGTHLVVLAAPGLKECMDHFAIEIWSNDDGEITAVNLLLGSP